TPDVEALAAKVLHLGDSPGPYDDVRHAELVWTITAAAAAGRNVHNPIALAAYHLQLNDMLSPDTLIKTPDSEARGRDWTRKRSTKPLETAYYLTSPDGTLGADLGARTPKYTPWNVRSLGEIPGEALPFFVVADGGPDHIDMPWPDGTTRPVPAEEIAELLVHDTWLNIRAANISVALLVRGADTGSSAMSMGLTRREATARSVFALTVPFDIHDDPATGTRVIVVTADPGQKRHWVHDRPPRLRPRTAAAGQASAAPTTNAPADTGTPTAHTPSDSSSADVDAGSTIDDSAPADLVTNGPSDTAVPTSALITNAGPDQNAPSGSAAQAVTGAGAGALGTVGSALGAALPQALPARSQVTFARDSSVLDERQRDRVADLAHQLIEVGTRDALADISLPRMAVTGHSGGAASARGRGGRGVSDRARGRVDSVAGALRDNVRAFLRRAHQDAPPGARLPDRTDFAISTDVRDVRSGGRDRPERVTVEVTRSRYSEAVERLDALRRADSDPAVSGGLFAPEPLVRRVLHLGADDHVGSGQRRELYALVNEAMAAGRANSLAELGVYHLAKHGALSSGNRISSPSGRRVGRDLTGKPVSKLETRSYTLQAEGGPPGRPIDGLWHRKAGAKPPYVVVAEGGHDHVMVSLSGGSPRRVPMDEFIGLLALDPDLAGLPADVPVVLVIPGAGAQGLELPRGAAAKLGKTVWAHSGAVGTQTDPKTGVSQIVVTDPRKSRKPLGDWFPGRPGDLRPEDLEAAKDGFVRTTDGTLIPDSSIKTATLALDGDTHGRASFTDADLASREEAFRHLPQAKKFLTRDPVTDQQVGSAQDVPWAGLKAYFSTGHALPMRFIVEDLESRSWWVDGDEYGRYLTRRPSVRRLAPEDVIVGMSCFADAVADGFPDAGDLGRDTSA
ncbi:hypothetical protein M2271_008552, partial [Streptomyces sp. LBL]|uniref:lonely Cys domain-containing protein n=1 Tax=Streptomyces sp. LBL TaxID=2940562 RepID=UPI002475D76C